MSPPSVKEKVSAAEWDMRVALAACYRLVAHYGWDDLIFTHLSARVPGTGHHFLINPYGMMFDEITASSLVKVDASGKIVVETPFTINPAGFLIHSAIHMARENARCVLHVHSQNGVAVSSQKNGLLPISQQSIFVLSSLAYHNYEGVAINDEERPRLVNDLGDRNFLILRNHGLITVADNIPDAFLFLYTLESACAIQIRAQAGGNELIAIDPRILAGAKKQAREVTRELGGRLAWPGLLRKLDRIDASYGSEISMRRIPLNQWKSMGTTTFNYRGKNIFWLKGGREDPSSSTLLLIHGFPTASWDWEGLWSELSARYRLLTLDMIGFGFSDKPVNYDYSILDQASLYESFLEAQGVTECHVLAHDYGDTVAQELLARQSEPGTRVTIKSFCFLNGGLFPEEHRALRSQKLLLSPVGPLLGRFITKQSFVANMRSVIANKAALDPELLDGFWHLRSSNNGLKIMHKLIRYISERRQHRERWVGALQKSQVHQVPLKLIVGEDDPISGAHMSRHYSKLVPNANVTNLKGIGHYPQVEAPSQVLAAYLEFRDSIGG